MFWRLLARSEGEGASTTAVSCAGYRTSSAVLCVRFRLCEDTGVVSGVGGRLVGGMLIFVGGLLGVDG